MSTVDRLPTVGVAGPSETLRVFLFGWVVRLRRAIPHNWGHDPREKGRVTQACRGLASTVWAKRTSGWRIEFAASGSRRLERAAAEDSKYLEGPRTQAKDRNCTSSHSGPSERRPLMTRATAHNVLKLTCS